MPEWKRVDPRPEGLAQPLYVRKAEVGYPSCAWIELHRDFGGELIVAGAGGIDVYESNQAFTAGANPIASAPIEGPVTPPDGWAVVGARSDQTGGMTMVDVLTFTNGWVLTILAGESVMLWRCADDYEAGPDGHQPRAMVVIENSQEDT